MTRSRARKASLLLLAVALAVGACKDTTPLDYADERADAGVEAGVRAACADCVTEGPCKADWDTCGETPDCQEFGVCLLEDGCFSLPTLETRIPCGVPCFERFGIMTGLDPELQALLPINGCTTPGGPCGSVCVPP